MKKISQEEKSKIFWHKFLTEGEKAFVRHRHFFRLLPSNPRCKFCAIPFSGFGGNLSKRIFGKSPSKLNPHFCNACDTAASAHPGGVEVEISMLFADVRGSTSLAEKMSPSQFSLLLNEFYSTATDVLTRNDAIIDKFVGDEVVALYTPGFAGDDHALKAILSAQQLLKKIGYGVTRNPSLPIGVGVHTGVVFCGSVGKGSVTSITALGDPVNVTARLASQAGAGEILVSEKTLSLAKLSKANLENLESRTLTLKGKSKAFAVRVLQAT